MNETPQRSFTDMVHSWINIFKSVPAEQLEDLRRVEDIWNEPGGQFATPKRTEIKTGSPQAASGGGAERMVREYSDPAEQMGMTEKYAEFSAMLGNMGKAIQSSQAQITALATLFKGIAPPAAPVAAKGADTSFLAKAESKLKKARSELRKAEMSDTSDKDEREECKSFLTEAGIALKSAKLALVKAEDEESEDEDRAEKARSDFRALSKALRKAEDEGSEREKREEEDMEKARIAAKAKSDAEATAKAEADAVAAKAAADAAVTAAKAEHGGEAKEEDETEKARKAAEAAAKSGNIVPVDPSVRDQIMMLSTSVKGLMDVVMAGSKGRPLPTFIKAGTTLVDLATKVDDAINSGALEEPMEIAKAQTLVTRVRAVQEGHMDGALVDDEIAKSPENVRRLFATAA